MLERYHLHVVAYTLSRRPGKPSSPWHRLALWKLWYYGICFMAMDRKTRKIDILGFGLLLVSTINALRIMYFMKITYAERNSQYRVEMGIYVSSFAATIFIAGLVTVAVSLITLLVALAVMLQTCQTNSTGVLERQRVKTDDYEYCRVLSLHLELNHLGLDALPAVCNEYTSQYLSEGHYARDLNITLGLIEGYFNSINPGEDGQDAVLMDADDFFSPEFRFTGQPLKQSHQFGCHYCDIHAINLKHHVLEMYTKLRAGGWPLILLSRKPERLRNMMVQELTSAGYGGWSSLIMRMDDQAHIDCKKHILRNDSMIQKQDYQIVAAISSRWDFLTGSCRGRRNFRLPNPIISRKMEDKKAEE